MALTHDQAILLDRVSRYHETNRRTDRLAVCLANEKREAPRPARWDNSHVPFIGLQLRELGYVTTYKDNNQYARWDITPAGRAALAEHQNVGKKPAKEAPVTVPVQPAEYIVLPVTKNFTGLRFSNEEEALHKAKQLANLNGYDYVVLKAHVCAQIKYISAVAAKLEVIKP